MPEARRRQAIFELDGATPRLDEVGVKDLLHGTSYELDIKLRTQEGEMHTSQPQIRGNSVAPAQG